MSIWLILMWAALGISALSWTMTLVNLNVLRRSKDDAQPDDQPLVSICIPARDEEANIEACVRSLLEGDYANIEVVVYDDESSDATPAILALLAAEDERVRVAPRHPLPEGWVGKQHACQRAAEASTGQWLLFTDADVRFAPDAIRRSLAETHRLDASMVSLFPKQITGTISERLVVPMIFFILMSYLPMPRMRTTLDPAASAGCGQFLMVQREPYFDIGGHGAWRNSMHDGIKMPRTLRAAGYKTDLIDGTDLASCRMYAGLSQVWRGFTKNAYEGLGSPILLVVMTVLHLVGHVLPWFVLIAGKFGPIEDAAVLPAFTAIVLAVSQRMTLAFRFEQSELSPFLHPIGVLMMTAIQWHSFILHAIGKRSWRGRVATQTTS